MARWWVAALGALVLLGLGVLPAEGDTRALDAYRGVWEYADGQRGRHQIEVAIERAVDGLPFFVEPFASAQIRDVANPFRRVRFMVSDDRLAFRADAWGPVSSEVGGPAEEIRDPDGNPISLRQFFRDGRLVQVFSSPDGSRENVFALSGDERWIWMSVCIESPQLPADVRYRLRYRRVGAPTQHAQR